MKLKWSPLALQELIDAVEYYNRQRRNLGMELLNDALTAESRALERPLSFPITVGN